MPSDAELVFEGVRSRVYQWDQELYDGSVARFERAQYPDGAFALPILENGNILLTKQEQPGRPEFISLPGGMIDADDATPLEAAKRELLEETGYVSDSWHTWTTFEGIGNSLAYVSYFIARNCKRIAPICGDGGEKIELFEVSFEEFLLLSGDVQFRHHWNIALLLYEARVSEIYKQQLYATLYTE